MNAPELGNEEIFASRTLIDQLRANRFEIETDIAGHARIYSNV